MLGLFEYKEKTWALADRVKRHFQSEKEAQNLKGTAAKRGDRTLEAGEVPKRVEDIITDSGADEKLHQIVDPDSVSQIRSLLTRVLGLVGEFVYDWM